MRSSSRNVWWWLWWRRSSDLFGDALLVLVEFGHLVPHLIKVLMVRVCDDVVLERSAHHQSLDLVEDRHGAWIFEQPVDDHL